MSSSKVVFIIRFSFGFHDLSCIIIEEAEILTAKKAEELLSPLEDDSFCVVSHTGLVDSDDFDAICLEKQFDP